MTTYEDGPHQTGCRCSPVSRETRYEGDHHHPERRSCRGRWTTGRNARHHDVPEGRRFVHGLPRSWGGRPSPESDHRTRCSHATGTDVPPFSHHRSAKNQTQKHHDPHQLIPTNLLGTIHHGRSLKPADRHAHGRHGPHRMKVGRLCSESHGRCRGPIGRHGCSRPGYRRRPADHPDRGHPSHQRPGGRTSCCHQTVSASSMIRSQDAFRCRHDRILPTHVVRFAPVRPDRHHHCCSRRHPASLVP